MNPLRYIFVLAVICGFATTSPAWAQGGPAPDRGRGPGPGPRGPDQRGPDQRGPDRRGDDQIDDDRSGPGETRGMRPGRHSPELQRELDEFWDKNRQKIMDFCKENSPNRWSVFQRRLGDVRFRPPRDRLLIQLKHLMELENADPELYKIKIAQVRVEDAEFGLARQINWARDRGQSGAPELHDQLREKAKEAIHLRLQERQLRLARLQKRFEAEKERLAKDMANIDPLVNAHVEDVIKNPPGPPPMRRQQTTSQPGATQ